jgi:hypothetical protein
LFRGCPGGAARDPPPRRCRLLYARRPCWFGVAHCDWSLSSIFRNSLSRRIVTSRKSPMRGLPLWHKILPAHGVPPTPIRGQGHGDRRADRDLSRLWIFARQSRPGPVRLLQYEWWHRRHRLHFHRGFSAVADLTGEHSTSVNGGSQGLSLVSFTAGLRFSYPVRSRYGPFAQTLFGVVHGFDSYFPSTSGPTATANGFAMIAGGGMDIRLKSYLAIRPFQADYFLTHLPNGVNDRQNNFRLTAGIVLRIW